jgi:hydroxymethylbilane synthase
MRTTSSSSTPERLIFATRASRLALTQTNLIVDQLRAAHPGIEIEVLEVTTTGDRDQRPFSAIGGKGLFTSEVERAVIEGRADVAVHSAKDLTAELGPGCRVLCVPTRAARADVVVGGSGPSGEERLRGLSAGATVGTSSMRRRAQLAELRRDVEPVELRGNLDTRLEKVRTGKVTAAILAAAGLERLGIEVDAGMTLDPLWWVPAPGQGALAIEALAHRTDLDGLFAPIADSATTAELAAERAFGARLEGGCSVPLGCTAIVDGTRIAIYGFLGSPSGMSVRESVSGDISQAPELGMELAEAVLVAGGDQILVEVEAREAPEVDAP